MNVVVSAIVDPWVTTLSFVVALAMRIQAQKFAQFEAFPKLIVTRMTSRNLLIDAVSALRFACLCPETVQLWKRALISGWRPVSST